MITATGNQAIDLLLTIAIIVLIIWLIVYIVRRF